VNRKHMPPTAEAEANKSGEYAVHRHWLMDIVALAICLALALLIWIVVMNTENTEEVSLRVLAPQEGYTYTLSIDRLEVEGKAVDLKSAESIGVCIPGHTAGTYTLTEEDLVLPEGVQLTDSVEFTLTVRPQS